MNIPVPPPPKFNRTPRPPGVGPEEYVPPGPPPEMPEITVGSFKGDSKLSMDETTMILRTTLLPEHREDPNVLRFIAGYMRCRDAAQAAREAGINPRSGAVLRARPDIHAAISKLTQKSLDKYGFDASEVIEKVKEIAGIDPIEFENPDGSFKTHMKDIAPESRRAIKKFKAKNIYEKDPNGMPVIVGQLIEVELWDKMKAVELLGREKDLFKETRKIEHDVTSNMAELLLGSKDRAERRLNEVIDVTPQIVGRVAELGGSHGQEKSSEKENAQEKDEVNKGSGL